MCYCVLHCESCTNTAIPQRTDIQTCAWHLYHPCKHWLLFTVTATVTESYAVHHGQTVAGSNEHDALTSGHVHARGTISCSRVVLCLMLYVVGRTPKSWQSNLFVSSCQPTRLITHLCLQMAAVPSCTRVLLYLTHCKYCADTAMLGTVCCRSKAAQMQKHVIVCVVVMISCYTVMHTPLHSNTLPFSALSSYNEHAPFSRLFASDQHTTLSLRGRQRLLSHAR